MLTLLIIITVAALLAAYLSYGKFLTRYLDLNDACHAGLPDK